MLHLTSCKRLGKDGDPRQAEIADLRDYLLRIKARSFPFSGRLVNINFVQPEWEICIAALRIASEL